MSEDKKLPNPAWVTAKYEELGMLDSDDEVKALRIKYPKTKYSIEAYGPDERGFFIYAVREL